MSDGFWMAVVAVLSGLLMVIGSPKARAWFQAEIDRRRGISPARSLPSPGPKPRPRDLAAQEEARHTDEQPELLYPWFVPEWGGKCYEDDVFEVHVISKAGTTLKLPEAKEVSLPRDGVVILDRAVCYDFSAKPLFDARQASHPFRFATSFSEGMALISDSGQTRFGFVERGGFGMVIPLEYHEGHDFHDGVALVRREEQWGFVDRTGLFQPLPRDANRISPLPVADPLLHRSENAFPPCPARDFRNGLAAVFSAHGKWGFIDKTGHWVIPPQFDWAGSFSEGRAAVRLGRNCFYIDGQGKVVVSGPFTFSRRFVNGLAPVLLDGPLWGLVNISGTLVVKPAWISVESCADGVVPFTVELRRRELPRAGLYHVDSGEAQILERLTSIRTFSEGLGVANGGGSSYGYIDTQGNVVVDRELHWSNASSFHEGLALVESRHL